MTATGDLFDALTSELSKADALAYHIQARLEELSSDDKGELYALSLVAEDIADKHALALEKAKALLDAGGPR